MFGGVNVWRIGQIKSIWQKKFGEWIGFSHKDAIYKLKFGWLKFGEARTTRQIHQTFLLPNIPAIRYMETPDTAFSCPYNRTPLSLMYVSVM